MNILLDTHVIIWALTDDPRLPGNARELISSPDSIILYSAASLWEIALKNQKSPDKCPYREKEIADYCRRSGYEPLGILPEHIFAVRDLAVRGDRYLGNHDPFDRILIAQAKTEDCLLLTHDTMMGNYDERCICMI